MTQAQITTLADIGRERLRNSGLVLHTHKLLTSNFISIPA